MEPSARNDGLERCFRESGWTLRQFAQAVNRVGTDHGTPLRYREPSVHQWLSGRMPRPRARAAVVEALTRRLGRTVSHAEVGFPVPEQPRGGSTAEELVDLGSDDMSPSRRSALGAGLFSVAVTVPGWQDVVGRMDAAHAGSAPRIGRGEVEAVVAMTERLSELDDEFGGRHARPMAAAFLVNTVSPYLRADASPEVRRQMMGAAAFLCYLTGWMAVDEGLHGLAQRYYVKGLELAGAADDHSTYRHVLRGMSVQAADLGLGAAAVQYADAAASDAASTSEPRLRAFFAGQQAHARAVHGDAREARRLLHEAHRCLERAESRTATFGGYAPSTLAYHEAQVKNELADTAGSIGALKLHFRLRDGSNDSHRSGIRFTAMLAERQLRVGHLDRACASWKRALDSYSTVKSGRVDRQMQTMYRSLSPHSRHPAARELREQAEATLPRQLREEP